MTKKMGSNVSEKVVAVYFHFDEYFNCIQVIMLRILVTADEQLNIDHNVIHKGLMKQASAAESANSLGAQLGIPFYVLLFHYTIV